MFKRMIKTFIQDIKDKRLTTVAGAWVYYFLSSALPLAFLLVTAFGVFGVNVSVQIVDRLPEEFRTAGHAIISAAENASNGVTIFFIITVVISCSTLLNQMSKDGDYIYGVNSKYKRGIMRRVSAVFAIIALFFLFLGAAFLFAFGSMVFAGVHADNGTQLFLTILTFLLVICFGYAIILLLNVFISPVRLSFKGLALGSFISLSVIVVGTIGFTVYLRFFSNYNAFYGSLAAIVIFLLWAYICMLGLACGAIINMRVNSKLIKSN
ncbi:MAG: YihY/virulence factor BrkB family protein [Clostridia bacterium]|nr:YihY/virulence factor BrkB family protein [Clostridia bacterium]